MVTGYEGYTLSELEREARSSDNLLALEIIERIERQDSTMFQKMMVLKPRTKYTDGSTA